MCVGGNPYQTTIRGGSDHYSSHLFGSRPRHRVVTVLSVWGRRHEEGGVTGYKQAHWPPLPVSVHGLLATLKRHTLRQGSSSTGGQQVPTAGCRFSCVT